MPSQPQPQDEIADIRQRRSSMQQITRRLEKSTGIRACERDDGIATRVAPTLARLYGDQRARIACSAIDSVRASGEQVRIVQPAAFEFERGGERQVLVPATATRLRFFF